VTERDEVLLTPTEASELLRVSQRTLERLNLPYIKVGRLRRYLRSGLMEYIDQKAS
jgi:excisionase family DNA binding protein